MTILGAREGDDGIREKQPILPYIMGPFSGTGPILYHLIMATLGQDRRGRGPHAQAQSGNTRPTHSAQMPLGQEMGAFLRLVPHNAEWV